MKWDRGMVIGIAKASCVFCHGYGLKPIIGNNWSPCECVYRKVFRICLAKFHSMKHRTFYSGVDWSRIGSKSIKRCYGRRCEEFSADFYVVAKRELSDFDWRLFKLHMIGERNSTECVPVLGCNKTFFYKAVYRIEEQMGKVYAELQPYRLFPLSEYFSSCEPRELLPKMTPQGFQN